MSRFKMHAHSKMLPRTLDWEQEGRDQYRVDLDDEAPEVGSIVEATRQARCHSRDTHREFASWHEAYAVIREELEEFWDSVKRNQPDLDELLQVAACCQLAIKELGNTGGERELNTYEISGPTKSMRESLARAVAEQEGRDELL
ncbi:hypothetical protein DRQ53_15120 [bacterium]|nr:MAG: hypothetical protein DRQ53_15120 [bacterium]